MGKTRYLFAGWSKRLDIDQFLEGSEESIVCFAQLTLLEFRYSFTISDCKATYTVTINNRPEDRLIKGFYASHSSEITAL